MGRRPDRKTPIPQKIRAGQQQGQEKQDEYPGLISDIEDVETIGVEVQARQTSLPHEQAKNQTQGKDGHRQVKGDPEAIRVILVVTRS